MATSQVLDWSNFTEVPTDAQIQQAMADGWDAVILGTQFPDVTRRQYDACLRNNFPVRALYVFVYWDSDDPTRLTEARLLAAEWGLKVWLDCEWTKRGFPGTGTTLPGPDELVGLIHQYKNTLAEFYAGIYTGRWWWPVYTNNCLDFSGDALWHADYSRTLDSAFTGFLPYGGWDRPLIVQYSSNGADGITADLNEEDEIPMPPVVGYWMNGDRMAGYEVRVNQIIMWHANVEIEAWGDLAGLYPGERWHNAGGSWVKEAA